MRVLLFGATGMVGRGVLLECLADPSVKAVTLVSRRSSGVVDPKVEEILHQDFFDYTPIAHRLGGFDACLFCLGVSSAGMSEERYTRLTHDLTLAAVRAVLERSPEVALCYVSGAGTDSSGKGRVMWARVKGRTENALLGLPFRAATMFRPGYIQPVKGVRSRTPLYWALYAVVAPLYPVIRRLFPRSVLTTAELGRAMIRAARDGAPHPVLEVPEIQDLARGGGTDA